MTQIRIKRVYEEPNATDGYRVLVDRLWPRGIKKEHLKYDVWEKDINHSPELRKWFQEDPAEHWEGIEAIYRTRIESMPRYTREMSSDLADPLSRFRNILSGVSR